MITKEFEEAYQRLNLAQKEAVDTIEGPVMVIAGPGTGKTQILTLRIANILQTTDTPPNGILALTFTEAGEKAMRLKLRNFIGSRADEIGVYTYHGFALSVIGEFQDHFPHLARAKQLTEVEAEGLVREILREKKYNKLRPLGEPDFYVGKIIKTISDCRKEAWTPEDIKLFAEKEIDRIKNDPDSISTRGSTKGKLKAEAEKRIEKCEKTIIFADAYAGYEAKKREEKRIDFDDLIFELILALENDELLLRLIQEKYLYILVDEHQDTNNSQNLLIKKIADFYDEPNLFVVGDEKQAIYRFQGASVQNFLQFQNIWPRMKVISLVNNYRSHQGILDASFGMIEYNYGADEYKNLRIKLKSAGSDSPEPVEVVMAGNNEAVEKYLVKGIKNVVTEHQDQTIAVIVRTNREVERVLAVLESEGLSASAERGTDIFSHPLGILSFQLFEFLADYSKSEALAYTLAGGLWHLDLARSAQLIKQIRSGNLSGIEKEVPALSILKKEITKLSPIEFLILAGDLSGLANLATASPLSIEVWRGIIELAKDLTRVKQLEDSREVIKELLAYRQTAEKRSLKILAGSAEAQVKIMTAHSSKGLEYDHVFLPYATEESWMSKGRGVNFILPAEKEEGDEVRDARRLFYVALTRAKKHASIIVGLEDGLKRVLTPLRFIAELDQENIARTELPASYELTTRNSQLSLEEKNKSEFVEYIKNILLETGLSVTALNHFCECPSKFFYKSILKVPEAPSASAEKGNAMHEALAMVWSLPKKDEKIIKETIEGTIQNYFNRSLLPAFEKEAVLEELLKNASKVAVALPPHFLTKGEVSAEKWVESKFEGNYDNQKIELRLHGKMDAIIDTPQKVLVYDYKTKEVMSERAIKGETKSDDGNYFRQLIFYKILIAESSFYHGKEVEPALVFIKPDKKGNCPTVTLPITLIDTDRVKKEIQNLIDSVWSGQILSTVCDDPKCEFCQLRQMIN